MAADSAVRLDFGDSREYITGRKSYFFPGIGCVTTWGSREANNIGPFLDSQNLRPGDHNIDDLMSLTYEFLVSEYRPSEMGLDDVGYHVAGFGANGNPKLAHIFWGYDRPRPSSQTHRKYERYDHSPPKGAIALLYNGRNDLAHVAVSTLTHLVQSRQDTRFNLQVPDSRISFVDFVVRFGAELTPEVGPPFIIYVISEHNQGAKLRNDSLCPLDTEDILSVLDSLQ